MLTEDMFKQRAPDNGDILFRALKNLIRPTDTVANEEGKNILKHFPVISAFVRQKIKVTNITIQVVSN